MMAPELHTPLESLLLFQTLHSLSENTPPSFVKISELLKNNDILRDTECLDRLEPDPLRNLYLRLLKEEARAQARRQPSDAQPNPRKRKLSSPSPETVDEALQYQHLLPQLVNRLYFRYRDHAIDAIKDEERKHRLLQIEIQDLEREEWHSRPQHQETVTRPNSQGVPSIQALLRYDDEVIRPRQGVDARPESSHEQPRILHGEPLTSVAIPNGYAQSSRLLSSGEAYNDQDGVRKTESGENSVPFLPPPQHLAQGYSMGSPQSDINRRLPPLGQSQSHPAPLPSPRSKQATLPRPDRSSGSPRFLPPIQGMLRSSDSSSPARPLDAPADAASQQYRISPAMPSPRSVQQHPHQLPPPQNYMQQRPYSFYDNQPPYQGAYPPYGQAYSPHHGTAQAYSEPLPSPNHGSSYGNGPHYQSPLLAYSQYPGYPQAPGYYQRVPLQTPYPRTQAPRYTDQYTPLSSATARQRPPKPSPIHTSGSATKWKNVSNPGTIRQASPIRPRTISPISDRALSLSPEPTKTRSQGLRNPKGQPSSSDAPGEVFTSRSTRIGQSRSVAKGAGGVRAASVASSTVAEAAHPRTRSHSIVSQIDELVTENQISRSRKIKPEPSTASLHKDDASIASHTADEGSWKSARHRKGTLRGLKSTESSRTGLKRKRESLSNLPPPSPSPAEPPISHFRPGYVLGTRNFARTSATIMNDIMSHKVANLFGRALTERDAPGYKDVIFRPQDLKSIKTAINTGSKALVAAVAEKSDDVGNSYNVWIPETSDVVPPKGIVNSAQLEKELMRMFANAIMYNPDLLTHRGIGSALRSRLRRADFEDDDDEEETPEAEVVEKGKEDVSVVKDTREMFEAVEPRISEWRNAEKAAEEVKGTVARLKGESEMSGLDGVDESEEGAGDDDRDGEVVLGSVEVEEAVVEPKTKKWRR